MENSIELRALENLIQHEKGIYTEAIKNNQQFENVKNLYLKIKKLEKEADQLMQQQLPEKIINCSAVDEINFLKIKRDFISQTQAYIAAVENLSLQDLLDPGIYSKVSSLHYQSVLAATKMSEVILKSHC